MIDQRHAPSPGDAGSDKTVNSQATPKVRSAGPDDRDAILAVHLAAFGDEEGAEIVTLVDALLVGDTSPPTLHLVSVSGSALSGHVAFSPVSIGAGADLDAYILAPLGVAPGWQKSGIGSALVEAGLRQLASNAVDLVFVYGDPAFYGRFGFGTQAAERFNAPHPLQYPFGWQMRTLTERGSAALGGRLACVAPLDDPALW